MGKQGRRWLGQAKHRCGTWRCRSPEKPRVGVCRDLPVLPTVADLLLPPQKYTSSEYLVAFFALIKDSQTNAFSSDLS